MDEEHNVRDWMELGKKHLDIIYSLRLAEIILLKKLN
jgi:hypothetical protein